MRELGFCGQIFTLGWAVEGSGQARRIRQLRLLGVPTSLIDG
jgi:hypothetical protein